MIYYHILKGLSHSPLDICPLQLQHDQKGQQHRQTGHSCRSKDGYKQHLPTFKVPKCCSEHRRSGRVIFRKTKPIPFVEVIAVWEGKCNAGPIPVPPTALWYEYSFLKLTVDTFLKICNHPCLQRSSFWNQSKKETWQQRIHVLESPSKAPVVACLSKQLSPSFFLESNSTFFRSSWWMRGAN